MWSRVRLLILLVVVAGGVVWVYNASRSSEPDETAVDAVARSTAPSPSDAPIPNDTEVPTQAPAPSEPVEPTATPKSTETSAPNNTPVPSETPTPANSPTPIVIATATAAPDEDTDSAYDYDIVTLLPVDAIPAIFDPVFLTAEEAEGLYAPEELVLGVEIDGDARAYSIPHLSRHEIVNDEIGGRKIAVTW